MDKIILISNPDDVLLDCPRILLVDLTEHQMQCVSDTLKSFDSCDSMAVYYWKFGDSIEWLLDKKQKADIIIFNAESENSLLVGYFSAQKKSIYFGNLKDLREVNNKCIYDVSTLTNFIENIIYE